MVTICLLRGTSWILYCSSYSCCRPNLSVGTWPALSITCGEGLSRYKCRSADTNYQSNCVIVTVFISTSYFVMRALSARSTVGCVWHWMFCRHYAVFVDCSLRKPHFCILSIEPSVSYLPGHMPPHTVDALSIVLCAENANHGFVLGIRVIKAATIPQLG